MESTSIRPGSKRRSYRPGVSAIVLAVYFVALGGANAVAQGVQSGSGIHPIAGETEPRVIQGRITAIDGSRVTVKTPDGYPGGPGVHAQFVTAGPVIEADIAGSRILQPDGRRPDPRPLAIEDRVLMVLSSTEEAAAGSGIEHAVIHAVIVERLATGDKIVSH
jgi:hypothetical protein